MIVGPRLAHGRDGFKGPSLPSVPVTRAKPMPDSNSFSSLVAAARAAARSASAAAQAASSVATALETVVAQ